MSERKRADRNTLIMGPFTPNNMDLKHTIEDVENLAFENRDEIEGLSPNQA
jgi:hypothetical protein